MGNCHRFCFRHQLFNYLVEAESVPRHTKSRPTLIPQFLEASGAIEKVSIVVVVVLLCAATAGTRVY